MPFQEPSSVNSELPPFGYIVAFLVTIVAVIIVANILARLTGWQEK
jgi:hypothetical protein